jgi:predicted nuclease of predicted toxin-antitoxin system
VRLLFDENLSRRLPALIDDLFPGSIHVSVPGLLESADSAIWEYARAHDLSIVSADIDFYEMATTVGPPPKVIWLRRCDYPTAVAERLIRRRAIKIADFLIDTERAVLILEPDRSDFRLDKLPNI